MVTLNISLPDEMKAFIEEQVALEGYSSISEYLHDVIRDVQKRQARRELETKLHEALLSGPPKPMTAEDWDGLERRVWERHHQDRSRS